MTRSKERKGERLREVVAELRAHGESRERRRHGAVRHQSGEHARRLDSAPPRDGETDRHATTRSLTSSGRRGSTRRASSRASWTIPPRSPRPSSSAGRRISTRGTCATACAAISSTRRPSPGTKAVAWSARPEEFVKRAGFVLMAALAVHDKKAPDERFRRFLPAHRTRSRRTSATS